LKNQAINFKFFFKLLIIKDLTEQKHWQWKEKEKEIFFRKRLDFLKTCGRVIKYSFNLKIQKHDYQR
jgi:hypothetical protein